MATDAQIAQAARRYVRMNLRYAELIEERPGDDENDDVYADICDLERELERLVLEDAS